MRVTSGKPQSIWYGVRPIGIEWQGPATKQYRALRPAETDKPSKKPESEMVKLSRPNLDGYFPRSEFRERSGDCPFPSESAQIIPVDD